MKYKYGFLGSGNMGGAMIHGVLEAGLAEKSEVIASCKSAESKAKKTEEFGITMTQDNAEVVKNSEIIILAVKPYQFDEVLPIVRENLVKSQIIVSVAAGKSISDITDAILGTDKFIENLKGQVEEKINGILKSQDDKKAENENLSLSNLRISRAMPKIGRAHV